MQITWNDCRFANMVACLRYSPVNVYSVYLPPSKVVFCYSECQDWLNQEIKEVKLKYDMLTLEK